MSTIQHLLQRWGFVKLRRYGLELTSDGRILSTRPAVLDDGTGGRVVGWQDGDVSIWKLSPWAAAPAAAVPAVHPEADPPWVPVASEAIQAPPTRPSARVMPADVAGDAPVDEDDWEWTIALARARVAVEEAEAAVPPAPDPVPPGRGRKTEPMGVPDYEDYRVSIRPALEIPRTALPVITIPRVGAPSTVIPVPALPTIDAAVKSRMEPVVRAAQIPAASAGRFAKGTAPLDPPRPAVLVEDTIPNLSVGDRTTPGVAPARAASDESTAIGERTRPGIALPRAARAVELPSIKRRTLPR